MDNNSRCYHGIQRIYRNAVVTYVRNRMTRAFGERASEKVREPFTTAEWDAVRSAAHAPRDSRQLDAAVQDDIDLLSVNHFFNIFEKHWVALMRGSTDAPESKTGKQAMLGWMREIKALRDPLSHPATAAFTRDDSFRLLDCARRVLSSLNCLSEASEIVDLIDEVLGSTDRNDTALDQRLPSEETVVVDFVGREQELSALRAWFDEPRSAIWALAGDGGKGKTAIAYTFAREIQRRAPTPFQIVLWLSAKRRRFLEGATTEIDSPDFHDLETALSQVLVQLGWAEDAALPIDNRKDKVVELLTEFPALVVVDDVDSLDAEGEDAITFFAQHVSRTPSKVLFTSRRTIFGLGSSTTHVSGFSRDDAIAFIHSRIKLMRLQDAAFTQAVLNGIVRLTDGSPLYIEDLLRLSISAKSPSAALEMWKGQRGSEVRRYALERECELLTSAARDILLAGCVADGSVSFSELSGIVGVDDDSVSRALQELGTLFLIPTPTFVKGEQRFNMNLNTRTLVREVYGRTEQWRRIEAAYQTITHGLPSGARSKIGAIIRQCGLLVKSQRHEEAEQLMQNALSDRPGDSDLYGFSGWIYKNCSPPRIADARRQFARAAELRSIKEDMYEHWARMEIGQREWTKAAVAAERGLDFIPDSAVLRYWAGRARGHLSKELMGGLHHDRAAKEAEVALAHLEHALKTFRADDRITKDNVYRGLVLLCETMTDVDGMGRFFRRWEQEGPGDEVFQVEMQRLEAKFRTRFGGSGTD